MPEINANIVVEPINLTIESSDPGITVSPEPLNLNIYTGGIASPAGNIGAIQYNAGGVFGGIPTANYIAGNLSLGAVGNVKITGGNNAYYLQTDGTGNLSWVVGAGNVTGNGTAAGANTQIQFTDGAGNFLAAAGFTFDNASNTFSAPGLINGGGNLQVQNADLGNVATANYFNGIFAAGNSNIAITTNGNIRISPSGSSNLYIFGLNDANFVPNLNLSNNLTVAGDAVVTGNIQVGAIANGNSNITVAANGNIELTATGNTSLVVYNTGIDVSGNIDFSSSLNGPNGNFSANLSSNNLSVGNIANISGNLNALANLNVSNNLAVTGKSNLNAVSNVTITGGANGQFIQTDGNGNLSFATVSTSSISNGNSSVSIPVADGNIINTVNGNTILTVTSQGANLIGTLGITNSVITANANVGTQLNVANITVTAGFGIALGNGAAAVSTGVAVGYIANARVANSTALGYQAKAYGRGTSVGYLAGFLANTGGTSVDQTFIGQQAGYFGNANAYSGQTSVGSYAGQRADGAYTVALGYAAGMGEYANSTVAVGQADNAIAIGFSAGRTNQKTNAIAIGGYAGGNNQGTSSIAIGFGAGNSSQANNSIVLNASGTDLNNTTANSLVIKPIRNATSTNTLYYNSTTGEVTYNTPTYGAFYNPNDIAITANTVANLALPNVSANSGVYIASSDQITIPVAGTYNIQLSIQLLNVDNASEHDFEVWFAKNGNNIADSATRYTIIKNNGHVVAALNFVDTCAANDYYQIRYAANNANISLEAFANISTPYVRPAIPSAIVTVVPVGA